VPVVLVPALGGFGPAGNSATTFDVFYWLQVTNYGVLYIPFDSAPSGSNYIDVWDGCLHTQIAAQLFRSNVLATNPAESKPKSCSCQRGPLPARAREGI
jgi:hypothetical protein